MKNILALVLVAMCSGCGMFKPKLSDNYATSALLALKAIEGDPYTPQKKSGLVSRTTQEKIDAADAAGVSNEEKEITATLNSVYAGRLRLNQLTKEGGFMEDSLKGGDFGSAAIRKANNDVKSDFDKNQGAMAILTAHLTDCISRLDNSLRARSTEIPAPCKVSFESGVYWTD